MDLARAPRRAPLTARKKGSGYENARVARRERLRKTEASDLCHLPDFES